MSDRLDFFFRQRVTEAELDLAFAQLEQADRDLAHLPEEQDLLPQLRHAIRALLPQGEPSLDAVARRLGVGARTLQRRLREHEVGRLDDEGFEVQRYDEGKDA